MELARILPILENIAPLHLAEAWDNVGLLVGDAISDITRILCCIDYSRSVSEERAALGAELVLAYHPPLFQPRKRLLAGDVVFDAARSGVALYSMHTALDVASGGTNDTLAEIVGLAHTAPLIPRVPLEENACKLVTFVPMQQVGELTDALFAAGAGGIGNYAACSFQVDGHGTFLGNAASRPFIGRAERRERVDETRIEVIVPTGRIEMVIEALRGAHPYETPAFDLLRLVPPPEKPRLGMGRIGQVNAVRTRDLIARIKMGLRAEGLLVAGPVDGVIDCAAVAAGSCGDMWRRAKSAGAQLYLTGEMRHHDAREAADAGLTVVCAGHSTSERPVIARLVERLRPLLPQVHVEASCVDREPFTFA